MLPGKRGFPSSACLCMPGCLSGCMCLGAPPPILLWVYKYKSAVHHHFSCQWLVASPCVCVVWQLAAGSTCPLSLVWSPLQTAAAAKVRMWYCSAVWCVDCAIPCNVKSKYYGKATCNRPVIVMVYYWYTIWVKNNNNCVLLYINIKLFIIINYSSCYYGTRHTCTCLCCLSSW